MTGPVNSPDLTDATLEAWITGAAFEYDVPDDGPARVLAAADGSARSGSPVRTGRPRDDRLPAGVRRLSSVRVPHPRLVAASVLVLASVGAAGVWGSTGSSNGVQAGSNTAARPAQPATPGGATRNLDAGGGEKAVVNGPGLTSSGTSSSSSDGVQDLAPNGAPAAVPAHNAPAPAATGFSTERNYSFGGGGTTRAAGGVADSAKIVHTGVLTLIVAKGQVTATLTKLDDLAAGAQGYVSSTKTSEAGKAPSGTVVLRVPADTYDSVLAQARRLGTVDGQTSSGVDVTAQSADLNAKMTSLKKVRENYLALLAKAKTIGETLSVQQHVDDNQAQIDQLQGQINVLADQAAYGTLTVTVTQKALPTPLTKPTHHKSGIAIAWDRAVNGFVTGVEALIARSGRAVLVLILLVGSAIVLRLAWRLGRRRLV